MHRSGFWRAAGTVERTPSLNAVRRLGLTYPADEISQGGSNEYVSPREFSNGKPFRLPLWLGKLASPFHLESLKLKSKAYPMAA